MKNRSISASAVSFLVLALQVLPTAMASGPGERLETRPEPTDNPLERFFTEWGPFLDRFPKKLLLTHPGLAVGVAYSEFVKIGDRDGKKSINDFVVDEKNNKMVVKHRGGRVVTWSCPSLLELSGRRSSPNGPTVTDAKCILRNSDKSYSANFTAPFSVSSSGSSLSITLTVKQKSGDQTYVLANEIPDVMPNWMPNFPKDKYENVSVYMGTERLGSSFVFMEFETSDHPTIFREHVTEHLKPFGVEVLSDDDRTFRVPHLDSGAMLFRSEPIPGGYRCRLAGFVSSPPEALYASK